MDGSSICYCLHIRREIWGTINYYRGPTCTCTMSFLWLLLKFLLILKKKRLNNTVPNWHGGIFPCPHAKWVSSPVYTGKPDGLLRYCIDMCSVNASTLKVEACIALISESIETLWFSVLDCQCVYTAVSVKHLLFALCSLSVSCQWQLSVVWQGE